MAGNDLGQDLIQNDARVEGEGNLIKRKTSIVTIVNNDQLCIGRAIIVGCAKLNRCSAAEWKDIAQSRGTKANLELILEHRKMSESHHKDLCKHRQDQQTDLAEAISRLAGVPLD